MKEIQKEYKTPIEKYSKIAGFSKIEKVKYQYISSFVKKGKVLDVGCSIGRFSEYLSKNINYYGIDNSKERINFAKQEYGGPKRKFIYGDALKMPFRNNTFDYVVILEIIEHVENPSDLLRECKRVLKKGGLLIGSTPNATDITRVLKSVLRRDHGSKQHLCVFGTFEIKTLLDYIGFKNINIDFYTFKIWKMSFKSLGFLFPNLCGCLIFWGEK